MKVCAPAVLIAKCMPAIPSRNPQRIGRLSTKLTVVAFALALFGADCRLFAQQTASSSDQEQQYFNSDHLAKPSKKASHDDDVQLLSSPIPHPYISFGPSLMGGGYAPLAYRAEAGIDLENTHAILRALGAYDNGHKTNDGGPPNPNGHDRYLEGAAYFRSKAGWFVGMGWRWSQLSTTNYTKSGTRPEIGGGYDLALRSCAECRRDFSMRINVDWVMAGTDWQNGSHGANTTLTFPAPNEKRHLFWKQTIGVYRYHQTVTDPSNLSLVQYQRSQKRFNSVLDFGLVYRF